MNQIADAGNTVVAYYDLKTSPITFDFCHFIVCALAYARLRGRDDFDLVIVADAYRNMTPRERGYTMVERQWRLWNLTVEITKLVPNIRNLTIAQRPLTTFAANTYPPNYHPTANNQTPYSIPYVTKYHNKGVDVRVFTPSPYAVQAAEKLVPRTGKKIITVTLRKASHDPQRDSKLDDWHEFIKLLHERGYQVVVIPDQDDSLSERKIHSYGWNVLDVVAMSLDLRLAIYNRADMNYVTNGGLVGLFMYSKVPFMWFSVIVEGSALATPDYYKHQGLEYGGKFVWLGDNQEMIWEPDTLANLTASLARIK
jgi:hypothetical protein